MKNSQLPILSRSVDIYAHRGSTVLAPENTSPAFELALAHGADVLEIDVRLSRDRHVMVIHDARVDRTCNGQGGVADMTLSDLKQLDAAHHFKNPDGRACRGQGVCLLTLDELFERYPDVRINVDIKDDSPEASKAVAACIKQADAHDRVNVGSFHAQTLNHFRQYAPRVTTAASRQEVAQLYFLGRLHVRPLAYEYLQIPVSYLGIPLAAPRFMKLAHSRQVHLVYWTINETSTMQRLIDLGAQGIVTDRPDLASQLLKQAAGTGSNP